MTNKMGRPKNKIPSEPLTQRWPGPYARWIRKQGSKEKIMAFIGRQLKKEK